MSYPVTDCCGARAMTWPDDGGAYETMCRGCHDDVCSKCAGFFDQEMDGDEPITRAYCKACVAEDVRAGV